MRPGKENLSDKVRFRTTIGSEKKTTHSLKSVQSKSVKWDSRNRVPENYGGLGLGFCFNNDCLRLHISGATGSLATAYGAVINWDWHASYPLYWNRRTKTKIFTRFVAGTKFGAYCLTEPDAGSDANSENKS